MFSMFALMLRLSDALLMCCWLSVFVCSKRSGKVTFTPPSSEPAQYSVYQGFVCVISALDKHFSAIAVSGQKNPGLQVIPRNEIAFPRVLIDKTETDYLILRNLMGAETQWTLRFRGANYDPNNKNVSAFRLVPRTGVLQPNQTVVVKVIFEPTAQGSYREVLEVVLSDARTASPRSGASAGAAAGALAQTVVSRLTLTGIGHSPKILGFPASLDFGCVPIGFFAYQWVDLTNDGFVDDVVHIYSQKPFLTSHLTLHIRAKARRRVCFFFRPTRSGGGVVLRSFSVLAGGRVVRIPCKGSGGDVRLSVRHDLKVSEAQRPKPRLVSSLCLSAFSSRL
jgi:hypothetical protein